jgi:hypothetical protein
MNKEGRRREWNLFFKKKKRNSLKLEPNFPDHPNQNIVTGSYFSTKVIWNLFVYYQAIMCPVKSSITENQEKNRH